MCYSGKCFWENHMGDCQYYSYIADKVFEKFGLKWLCELPECEEHEEYLEHDETFKKAQEYAKELYYNGLKGDIYKNEI